MVSRTKGAAIFSHFIAIKISSEAMRVRDFEFKHVRIMRGI
jgi:hypothetical protein